MDKNLSWFIGPKAENASTFEDLLNVMVNDCFHWRKNYFPDDPLLITKSEQHVFDEENDKLYQNVHEFLAALRRNFPFYNPRYIAHMLSDITMPSLLGYIGGLLYNPNNVTTEAAPVTAEWEIEACNKILQMIGFKLPPLPPKSSKSSEKKAYNKQLKEEFGWAHIASGGTLANIEALWVARCVKYLPLSIKDVISKELPQLTVKLKNPSGETKNILDFDNFDLINIKPTESIYLLSKYIQAYVDFVEEKHAGEEVWKIDMKKASKEAMAYLNKSDYSLSNNMGKLLSEYPLAIFVSGTAHYSIHKAADLLGIGRNNIKFVEIGPDFRMDTDKLREAIGVCMAEHVSPLAVIGIVGTTEEGAIDPVHKIYDIRKEFEERNFSFWIHVDSAWGGYSKTILQLEPEQKFRIIANKLHYKFNGEAIYTDTLSSLKAIKTCMEAMVKDKKTQMQGEIDAKYPNTAEDETTFTNRYNIVKAELRKYKDLTTDCPMDEFVQKHKESIDALPLLKKYVDNQRNRKNANISKFVNTRIEKLEEERQVLKPYNSILKLDSKLAKELELILDYAKRKEYESALECMKGFYLDLFELWNDTSYSELKKGDEEAKRIKKDYMSFLNITLEDRIKELRYFTNYKLNIDYKRSMSCELCGDDENFVSAYLAFKYVDSVTIDPHKQGYLPYPCGIIAFKNDRIRHLIAQDAPYITSLDNSALVHKPPLHALGDFYGEDSNEKRGNCISAFAPFILEGSKPGASAASLWLTNKCIPLTVNGYGTIVRDSLLATRELYAWISQWNTILHRASETANYEIIPLSNKQPDLNVVVFAIKPKNSAPTLENMNNLTNKVYKKYSLQVELGNRQYSYGQPFFLSNTTFSHPFYSYTALSNFFKRCGVKCTQEDYETQGLTVLRATLMNPYLWAYKEYKNLDLVREFMLNLHNEIKKIVDNRMLKQ